MGTQRYAVNLYALMNASQQIELLPVYWLLRGIVTESVEQIDRQRASKDSLLVRDDVGEERWTAIVKVIRLKARKSEFPLYQNDGKGWRAV